MTVSTDHLAEPADQTMRQPTWRWDELEGPSGIDACADDWNALAHRGPYSPTADAIWMRCWWGAFGTPRERLVIHLLYRDDRLVAVLPLRKGGRFVR